jgi:hypothetical protein
VNYFHFKKTNYLLWSVKMYGGECTNESGFGLNVFHVYPMTDGGTSTHKLTVSPLSFLICFLAAGLAVWLIMGAAGLIRQKVK